MFVYTVPLLFIFTYFTSSIQSTNADAVRARAYVFEATNDISTLKNVGILDFAQIGGIVRINGTLKGLSPGPHGFHVHEKGDIGAACMSAAAHFNPAMKEHGAPEDNDRHVGDLGNINVPASGETTFSVDDGVISLRGPFSIIGRTIVIHEKADDLGKGGNEASKQTGNSGARIACGIIGIVN